MQDEAVAEPRHRGTDRRKALETPKHQGRVQPGALRHRGTDRRKALETRIVMRVVFEG